MSIIVNSAWKNKKKGDTVTFKGEEYTIGEGAFKSIEAAVDAGITEDLVIVDKKLSSPVKKQNIISAATDIFAAEVTESESKDGKTTTIVTKFSAAAGGTASIKDEAAVLNGFENVTAKNAGGTFLGGKQNVNINEKEFDDSSKGLYTNDSNSNYSSVASGSLTVTSAEDKVEVFVGAIPDADETVSAGDASFANLSLTNAAIGSANGGSITGKATSKYSNTKDEKITSEYSQSSSRKVGSGTADLTDSDAGTLKGFKTVNITASKAAVTVGDIKAGSKENASSINTSFEEDKSSSISKTNKETESVSGTVNLTGKNTEEQAVTLSGGIERAASINLKNAILDGAEIDTENGTENSSISISVKQQKDTAALTAFYSGSDSSTAAGSLIADKSIISVAAEEEDDAGAEGLKDVSISASTVNGTFDATNFKGNYTKKETGSALDGITPDQEEYTNKFGITYDSEEGHALVELDTELVDPEEAYSYEWTVREETSAGGGKFQISGKTADDSAFTAAGYKSVSLDNTNKEVALTATLDNYYGDEEDYFNTFSESGKVSFTPDSSYTKTYKETKSGKVAGDAVITGNVAADVTAFASVKISGENASLNSFTAALEINENTDKSWSVKASKDDPIGNYSKNWNKNEKGVSSLDASKMALEGGFLKLKSVKLQNIAGSANFSGSVDKSERATKKVTWNAEEISAAAAEADPEYITDPTVTAWSASNDQQSSASGTFTATNAKEELALSVAQFKSVKISGAIGMTTVNGVIGEDTKTSKSTEDLSVKGSKGTYSQTSSSSSKAATTVEITKATLAEGSSGALKSVKATEVAGSANFVASLDTESKYNLKAEWKADEITVAELVPYLAAEDPTNEAITSANLNEEAKSTVVGTLTLSNSSKDAVLEGLSAVNFKTVDLTFTGEVEGSLDTAMNYTYKKSVKHTASDTKITDEKSISSTNTSVASLKVTGKKADKAVITYAGEGIMAYSSVTLKDAIVAGGTFSARNTTNNKKESVSYSPNSDEGTYRLDTAYTDNGNGSFTASISGDAATDVDANNLDGYKTVTLKDKVSIGSASNYNYVGGSSENVAFTEEYDFENPEESEGKLGLSGKISGSYTRSKNGDVSAKWNAFTSMTASGSFTQTATVAEIAAGSISGYDKVTLDGVANAGSLNGSNEKVTTVATYNYTKGETKTNTIVTTTEWTASSSATVNGKKFKEIGMQTATVEGIFGYKTVTIENANVSGIGVDNSKLINTVDEVGDFQIIDQYTGTAIGTLTATDSQIGGEIYGFQMVKLSNTVTEGSVIGGNEKSLEKTREEEKFLSYGEKTAAGSFTAEAKQGETEYAVGDVSGYQKVALTNYSAGVVSAGFYESELENAVTATYVKMTDADEDKDIPASWQKAAKSKGNTFTATASSFKEDAAPVNVGGVTGYDKVEATNLASIGSIDNFVITAYSPAASFGKEDPVIVAHYGDWTASSVEVEDAYTSIKVTAGASVTISGQKDQATAVTGNVAGYAKITMDKVALSGEAVVYSAGDYSYTAKADKNDVVTETESTKSNGTLQITKATAEEGTAISMTGFKTISAEIDGAVTINTIIGGNSDYKFVDGEEESFTYTLAGSVDLTTAEGSVIGEVNGFESLTFTDTNFAEGAIIKGHDSKKANYDKYDAKAKATITFIDNDADGQGQFIAGTIVDAKEIVFKSKADDEVDFDITGTVDSHLGNDTKISFVKSQANVDLSKFLLDEGDVIDLSSGSTIFLGGEVSDLEAYFEKMSGSQFTGSGTIAFSGVTVDDVKAALDDADIKYAKTIKFAEAELA